MNGEEARAGEGASVPPVERGLAHDLAGRAQRMYRIYLGLGANLGDRRASLRRALRLLAHLEDTRLLRVSSFYETPPWGNEKQPPFLNACAALETRLSPLVFLRRAQRIERALGRARSTSTCSSPKGSRVRCRSFACRIRIFTNELSCSCPWRRLYLG